MNTPVNFEIAKLLKEKGFDEPVHQYYQFIRNLSSEQDKTWQLINSSFLVRESDAAMFPDEGKNGVEVSAYSDRIYRDYNFKTSEDFISAPTIAEVVMWLYEKRGLWITIDVNINGKFNYLLRQYNSKDRAWEVKNPSSIQEYFNNPDEAYESAIEYTLNKLIEIVKDINKIF